MAHSDEGVKGCGRPCGRRTRRTRSTVSKPPCVKSRPAQTGNQSERRRPSDREAQGTRALWSIAASAAITLAKGAAGLATGSLALISDAAHSLLDVASTTFTWLAVRAAHKPADEEHQYGHGKVESLAALVQTAFLFLLSGAVAYEGVRRLAAARRNEPELDRRRRSHRRHRGGCLALVVAEARVEGNRQRSAGSGRPPFLGGSRELRPRAPGPWLQRHWDTRGQLAGRYRRFPLHRLCGLPAGQAHHRHTPRCGPRGPRGRDPGRGRERAGRRFGRAGAGPPGGRPGLR